MEEIKSKAYLIMYENSIKTDTFVDYIMITTKNGDSYINSEVVRGDETITSIIESHTSDMVKFVFYSRPVGLFDDIEVYGPATNIGETIYFGRRMTAQEAIEASLGNQEIIVLDSGEVLTNFETGAKTYYEVWEDLKKEGQKFL